MVKVGVVIPAAGQGKRMGAGINKQFLELAGAPVLSHTIRIFQLSEQVEEIVIVGANEDIEIISEMVRAYNYDKVGKIVVGGKERQDSVYIGVQALSPTIDRVVVHDGARPLLTLNQFQRFLEAAEGKDGVIMAIPLKDTVKVVDELGKVIETPDRNRLRAVQTPQFFKREILHEVHGLAKVEKFLGTDDASLLEWQGYKVYCAEGYTENIKVTTPEDLWLAAYIMEQRTKEGDSN